MNDRISKVLDCKGRQVASTSRSETVISAVERMNSQRIGALLVLDGIRPVGIFTERDVLVRVVSRGLDPMLTLVGDVMTHELVAIRFDATVSEAMMAITKHRCRHLPVLDGDGGVCGLISIGDLTSWMVRDQQRTIDDLHNYIRAA